MNKNSDNQGNSNKVKISEQIDPKEEMEDKIKVELSLETNKLLDELISKRLNTDTVETVPAVVKRTNSIEITENNLTDLSKLNNKKTTSTESAVEEILLSNESDSINIDDDNKYKKKKNKKSKKKQKDLTENEHTSREIMLPDSTTTDFNCSAIKNNSSNSIDLTTDLINDSQSPVNSVKKKKKKRVISMSLVEDENTDFPKKKKKKHALELQNTINKLVEQSLQSIDGSNEAQEDVSIDKNITEAENHEIDLTDENNTSGKIKKSKKKKKKKVECDNKEDEEVTEVIPVITIDEPQEEELQISKSSKKKKQKKHKQEGGDDEATENPAQSNNEQQNTSNDDIINKIKNPDKKSKNKISKSMEHLEEIVNKLKSVKKGKSISDYVGDYSTGSTFKSSEFLETDNSDLDLSQNEIKELHSRNLESSEIKTEKDTIKIRWNVNKSEKKMTPKKKNSQSKPKDSTMELYEAAIEKNILTDEQIQMLKELQVIVPFEIPDLHALDKEISKFPSLAKQQTLEQHGITIKKGAFTYQEDRQIKKNWKLFCKVHDIPVDPKPFLILKHQNNKVYLSLKNRIRFMQFVSHKLNERMLFHVYQRFKLLFTKPVSKRGRFTPDEDKIILKFLEENTYSPERPIYKLSKVLNRTQTSVKKRINLLETRFSSKVIWDQDLINKFVDELLVVTECKNLYEFKDREITDEDYAKLAQKLHIPVKKLKLAWLNTIYIRIFIKDGSKNNVTENKQKLLKALYENNEKDWKTLDLKKYTYLCDGCTHLNLYKYLKQMVKTFVPKYLQDNLKECIKILHNDVDLKIISREMETYDYY